tara:strand:- start:2321 stop:2632 length:312 start_codon:yes stop_codon:yes gene_type:complete
MKKFISVGMLLFPSKGDQKMWLEKWDTFYSPKAIEFLKKNGQLNQRILLEKNNELIRTIVIWEYESEEAYKKCQAFHSNWSKFENNFTAKYQIFRVEEVSSWS